MLGSGIIKGLAVTAKNFAGSFHDPARFTTLEYPEVPPKLPEAYRNFPFLVTENATDPMGTLRCVACQICEKECPPQCIYIEKSKDKKPDAAKPAEKKAEPAAKPETKKPETKKPEAKEPEAKKPEAKKPAEKNPAEKKSEAKQSDEKKPAAKPKA